MRQASHGQLIPWNKGEAETMKLKLEDISDQEFGVMHESCLSLLERYGVLFENATARNLLTKAGNSVDQDGRVHLKPKFVESVIRSIPKDGFMMYGRDESKMLRVAVGSMSFRPSTGEPFILDYSTGKRREATIEDAQTMVRLTDALDGYAMVNAVINIREAPGAWENILLYIVSHRYSMKPSDVTVSTAREVRAVARIAAAIRGGESELKSRPLTAVDVSMISPLRCSHDEAEAFLEAARLGVPVEILSSPSMGISSPITIAGSVVVSMAEVLAAICLIYQVAPGLGVINTARISPINMRTGAYNYGAPELGMGSVLVAACSARYHIPTNLYGFGNAAKAAGIQSTMEKSFPGLLMALGRHHMITGSGSLDNALVTSPEMLVIDHEAIRFMTRMCEPIVISSDSIGIDVLLKGMRESGTLIAEEHTLHHLKAGEMMDCGLDQWDSLQTWEQKGKPDLLERAHVRVGELLASHSVPPFPPGVEAVIEQVKERFDKEMA
jgi:trimethylamine--corrinoid protein Co-methyltransferase